MTRTTLASLLVSSLLFAGVARGQSEPEASALARTLFHEGVELAEAENWAEAADRFRRAQELRPSVIIAFNLSLADSEIGRLVEASEMLQWVLRQESVDETMRADATARLEALSPRFARLTLVVDAPDASALRVALDGRELLPAALGVAMPVDPGVHTAVVWRGDEEVHREERSLAEGESSEWTLAPPPPPPRIDPAEVARQQAEEARRLSEAERRAAEEAARATFEAERAERRVRRRRRALGVTIAILVAGGVVAAVLGARASGGGNEPPEASLGRVDWR